MKNENVGVVILSHCDHERTIQCIRSILSQNELPRRLVVCDNGSENETAEKVFSDWTALCRKMSLDEPEEVFGSNRSQSRFVHLRLDDNTGVPAGFNAAINLLLYDKECEAFWLLHHDTEPAPYALSAMVKHLDDDAGLPIGIVGSTLVYSDCGLQECAGGGKWNSWTGSISLLDSGLDRYALSDRKDIADRLDFIHGASCLITRALIEKIGTFDPRLFFFYEDVEYSLRAKNAGFALNWAPGAVVRHVSPCSGKLTPIRDYKEDPELSENADYHFIRNRFYLLRKEKAYALPFALATLPATISSRFFRGQKDRIRLIFHAARDGIRGKFNDNDKAL